MRSIIQILSEFLEVLRNFGGGSFAVNQVLFRREVRLGSIVTEIGPRRDVRFPSMGFAKP
jgi:hypothetical protein